MKTKKNILFLSPSLSISLSLTQTHTHHTHTNSGILNIYSISRSMPRIESAVKRMTKMENEMEIGEEQMFNVILVFVFISFFFFYFWTATNVVYAKKKKEAKFEYKLIKDVMQYASAEVPLNNPIQQSRWYTSSISVRRTCLFDLHNDWWLQTKHTHT